MDERNSVIIDFTPDRLREWNEADARPGEESPTDDELRQLGELAAGYVDNVLAKHDIESAAMTFAFDQLAIIRAGGTAQ